MTLFSTSTHSSNGDDSGRPTPDRQSNNESGQRWAIFHPSDLFEPEIRLPLPRSLEEFAQQFDARILRIHTEHSPGIAYDPAQVAVATAFNTLNEKLLVESPTGSGKTYIALLACAPALAASRNVLFLTPDYLLLEQILRDAKIVFESGALQTFELSGNLRPTVRRKVIEQFTQENCSGIGKLFVATPELISSLIQSKSISMGNLGNVVFDEIHLAQGKHAYVPICEELTSHKEIRAIFLSAQVERTQSLRFDLMRRIGATRFIKLNITGAKVLEDQGDVVELPPKLQSVANQIMESINQVLSGIYTILRSTEFSRLGPDDLKKPIPDEEFVVLKTALSNRKAALLTSLERLGKSGSDIVVPSDNAYLAFRAQAETLYSLARPNLKRSEVFNLSSLIPELGELRHLYNAITTQGQFCFLNFCGRKIAEVNFGEGKAAAYLQRLYSLTPAGKAIAPYREIARGTPYEQLLLQPNWETIREYTELSRWFTGGPDLDLKRSVLTPIQLSSNKEFPEKFFALLCPMFLALRAEADHPKETRLVERIGRTPLGTADKALIRVDESSTALILSLRLRRLTNRMAYQIAGRKHMKRPQLIRNLERFAADPNGLLIVTEVGTRGLDIKGITQVFAYSAPGVSTAHTQLKGRAGRRTFSSASQESTLAEPPVGGKMRVLATSGSRDMLRRWANISQTRARDRDERDQGQLSIVESA